MKWADGGVSRAARTANLLAHEEAFTCQPPAKRKHMGRKAKPVAAVDRAAVAKFLSIFDHAELEDKSDLQQTEAAIGEMVLEAALGASPPAGAVAAAAQRTDSDRAADAVLGDADASNKGSGAGPSSAQVQQQQLQQQQQQQQPVAVPADRADSTGCFDLAILIREAVERYVRDKDERLLERLLAEEWVTVSRKSSEALSAVLVGSVGGASVDELEGRAVEHVFQAAMAAVAAAGGDATEGDASSDSEFVLV